MLKGLQTFEFSTLGNLNYKDIEKTSRLFFSDNKEEFLSNYYKLSNDDKFCTLYYCLDEFNNLSMAKKLLLEELRTDLINLKKMCLSIPYKSDKWKSVSDSMKKMGTQYGPNQ